MCRGAAAQRQGLPCHGPAGGEGDSERSGEGRRALAWVAQLFRPFFLLNEETERLERNSTVTHIL